MNYARIINNVAVDVVTADPTTLFTPQIAAEFVEVPATVQRGWTFTNDKWEPLFVPEPEPAPEPEPVVVPLKVSPVEFKLLFTPQERVAVAEARKSDVMIEDFFSIVDDPRLTFVDMRLQSTLSGIDYLVGKELLTVARRDEILSGKLQ